MNDDRLFPLETDAISGTFLEGTVGDERAEQAHTPSHDINRPGYTRALCLPPARMRAPTRVRSPPLTTTGMLAMNILGTAATIFTTKASLRAAVPRRPRPRPRRVWWWWSFSCPLARARARAPSCSSSCAAAEAAVSACSAPRRGAGRQRRRYIAQYNPNLIVLTRTLTLTLEP